MSEIRADTANQVPWPAAGVALSTSASAPRRRTTEPGLPVRIFLYLVAVGLVTAATVGALFSINPSWLAYPTGPVIRGSAARDRGAEVHPATARVTDPHDDTGPAPAKTELPRSAAVVTLPASVPQSPAASETRQPETGRSTTAVVPPSPAVAGGTASDATSSANVPKPGSAPRQAKIASPAPEPTPVLSELPVPAATATGARHFAASPLRQSGAHHSARAGAVDGPYFEQYHDARAGGATRRRARLEPQQAQPPAAGSGADREEDAWRERLQDWRQKLQQFWTATQSPRATGLQN